MKMVRHGGRDVAYEEVGQSKQQSLEQTEEENVEPLEDQPGENCSNLLESRRRHGQ